MRKRRRLSPQGVLVLGLFVSDPAKRRFGLEIIRESGIPSGVLYPILHLLEERKILLSAWEGQETAARASRRPRREYWLDQSQLQAAHDALREARTASPVRSHARPLGRPSTA